MGSRAGARPRRHAGARLRKTRTREFRGYPDTRRTLIGAVRPFMGAEFPEIRPETRNSARRGSTRRRRSERKVVLQPWFRTVQCAASCSSGNTVSSLTLCSAAADHDSKPDIDQRIQTYT